MTSLSPVVSIENAFAGSGRVTDEGVPDERLCIRKVLSHDAETTQSITRWKESAIVIHKA